MTLRITFGPHTMTVQTGTVGEPKADKFYSESALYHAIKKALNAEHSFRGEKCDIIKKRMWKDGHMVDDNQFYLRDRKCRYCFYDQAYAVRKLNEEFNERGVVTLCIHFLK